MHVKDMSDSEYGVQVPICENGIRVSEPLTNNGEGASTSLQRYKSPDMSIDIHSTQEDDMAMAGVPLLSAAPRAPFPAVLMEQPPHGHGHGHHCRRRFCC